MPSARAARSVTALADQAVAARAVWAAPPALGIGLPWLPGLDPGLYTSGLVDFVEITPDMLCLPARLRTGEMTMALDPAQVEAAHDACGHLPIVLHGVELSIGSAHGWNSAYVAMLDAWAAQRPFAWHSEHCHFQTVDHGDGRGAIEIGVPLPLPLTQPAVDLVAGRARALAERYAVPFLLENGAHYLGDLPAADGIADEAAFFNRVAHQGGCGLLLDLNNLYCNARNNGVDPARFLDTLDLARVGEIHLAGGAWSGGCEGAGFLMDAHNGATPDPVWDLLDGVLPRCPYLGGVVFEIMDDYVTAFGSAAIERELVRMRIAWDRHVAPLAIVA